MATKKKTTEETTEETTAAVGGEVLLLDPKEIKKDWRARKDYGDIADLADSIKVLGQMQPVVVRKNEQDAYVIIAGLRRTRACRKLGIMVRALVVEPKDEQQTLVMQLAENVKRKDFDRLEIGEGLKRFKRVYEKANPATKHGASGRGRGKGKGKDSAERFSTVASRELSVSEQTVYDLLGIADLPADELKEVEGAKTGRERNIAASKALSRVRKQRKEKKLEETAAKRQAERAEKEAAAEKKEAATAKKTGKKATKKKTAKKKGPQCLLRPGKWQDAIAKGEVPEIDLILADPQYNLKRSTVTHTARTSINEQVDWDTLDVGWVLGCAERLARTGTLIAFCPLERIGDYEAVCIEAGLTYRGAIVWHKTNPAPSHRAAYVSSIEAMIWATKGKTKYTFKPWVNAGSKTAHNMIEGPICGGNERLDHSAQKPLWLIEKLIMRHSVKGDAVFDPFAGTGTTLVAAKKMRRNAYGCEVSKKYLKLAVLRLQALA